MTHDIFLNRRARHFIALYEELNIHKAAKRLSISQSALTVSLKNLEDMIETTLFERSVKGLTPTPIAQKLYPFAITLEQSDRCIREEIEIMNNGLTGFLRIGTGVAWTSSLLPKVLGQLHEQFPHLNMDLITGVGDQLGARLLQGELDIVLAAGTVKSLSNPDFSCEMLTKLPMVAVADPHSRLAKQKRVTPQDLAMAKWVGFYQDQSIIQHANHYLSLHGLSAANIVLHTNSPSALLSLVKGTEFITILIAPLAEMASETGFSILNLVEPLWEMPVNLYHRKISGERKAVIAFKDIVAREMRLMI